MKGYFVNDGYMGMVEGRYMLFASEEDYRDYMDISNCEWNNVCKG